MAETLNYNINVGGNANESIGSLKKQLREAQNEVAALSDKFGATSKEAVIAAKRAAELRDRIGDAKSLTEAFNPDAKFKALTASLSGVAGGFAAVQGAIGLFGAESKALEKQLLKVQSALAISQGLQSIGESIDSFKQLGAVIQNSTIFIKANEVATKGAAIATRLFGGAVDTTAVSFKVLKGAIAATGIGLLVVGLGFLIEKLSSLSSSTEEAAEKQKKLNEELANTTKAAVAAAEKFIDSDTKLKIARAKLAGASEKELLEIEQNGIKAKIATRQRNYEDLLKTDKKAAAQLAEQNADAQDELALNEINFTTEQNKKIAEKNKEKNKEIIADQKAANDEYNKLMQERASMESDAQQVVISSYRATLPEREKAILEAEDELEKNKEVLIKAGYTNFEHLEAEHKIKIAAINKTYDDKDADDTKKNNEIKLKKEQEFIDQKLELQSLTADSDVEKRQAEIDVIEEEYNRKIELAKKNGESIIYLEAIKTAKIDQINKKQAEDEKNIAAARLAAQMQLYSDIGSGLGQLSDLFGKSTAASKAFTLAQIGIDTAAAISALTKNSESNPTNAVTFGASGAIQFATGLIRILANVKKAKDLLSNSKSSVSVSTAPANAPSFSPIQPQGQQAQLTQLNQASINAIGNQAVKAYVVESDISSSQQRIAAIQQRARFE